MRCSGWSSLAISVCSALAFAAAASAHVVATPAFLPSEGSESISFEAPNERAEPMTEFALIAPPGLVIEHAHPVEGWSETAEGSTATWSGGSLSSGELANFGVTLRADVEPGALAVRAEQRYADGSVVDWPVSITITPAEESPSQKLALAGIVALIGVLAIVAIGMLAWRRRSRETLQEK
jgi:uncharacterized protein YcnI